MGRDHTTRISHSYMYHMRNVEDVTFFNPSSSFCSFFLGPVIHENLWLHNFRTMLKRQQIQAESSGRFTCSPKSNVPSIPLFWSETWDLCWELGRANISLFFFFSFVIAQDPPVMNITHKIWSLEAQKLGLYLHVRTCYHEWDFGLAIPCEPPLLRRHDCSSVSSILV